MDVRHVTNAKGAYDGTGRAKISIHASLLLNIIKIMRGSKIYVPTQATMLPSSRLRDMQQHRSIMRSIPSTKPSGLPPSGTPRTTIRPQSPGAPHGTSPQ